MQVEHAGSLSIMEVFLGVIPVIIASFAYPLGNRKMMDVCGGRLDVFQRVLGMTIASMPLWIVLAIYGLFTVGPPSIGQSVQSGIIAITSGVIATILFFRATDLVRGNMQKLGNVEATQSISVLFAVIGELILLKAAFPSIISWTGMMLVIAGMILHSYVSHKGDIPDGKKAVYNNSRA
jgi:drug/metabolite transporter (DMT)-like permease